MNSYESITFWSASLLLAAGSFTALIALFFPSPKWKSVSVKAGLASFGLLTVWGVMRWIETCHPPFVTRFESMTISVWFMLLIFSFAGLIRKRSDLLSLPVCMIGFLMMGWASSMEPTATPLSAALKNTWLFIHASFATAGAGAFLIAASYSVIYLFGQERFERQSGLANRFPEYNSLPNRSFNFLIFGLILWGVMIVSGSIWANAAWGRYWAWDPIELWSLISWLIYGLVVHLRITFKLSNRMLSWLTIIAALTILFALWGVGYVYETIHTYG